MNLLGIGATAARTGLPASTLRYWEKEGLLPAAPRVGGRRAYDASALARIRLVQAALALGFSIREVRSLAAAARAGTLRTAARTATRLRLRAVDADIARARRRRAGLQALLDCACKSWDGCVLACASGTAPGGARR